MRRATDTSYRKYVTESLRLAPQMAYLSQSWSDVMERAKRREREKSAEEIVDGVVGRLEAMFGEPS